MKLTELKTELETVGSLDINLVLFEYPHEMNVEKRHYPLLFFDLNSFRSTLKSTRSAKEIIELNAFIFDFYDPKDVGENRYRDEVWDALRDLMKDYINLVNGSSSKIEIISADIENELYDAGIISIDHEIGVGYKLIIHGEC